MDKRSVTVSQGPFSVTAVLPFDSAAITGKTWPKTCDPTQEDNDQYDL